MQDLISTAIYLAVSLTGYFYYHTNFIRSLNMMMNPRCTPKTMLWLSFIINYMSFVLFGLFSLHLIVNWTLFTILLVLEMRLFYRCPWKHSLLHGLACTLMGLSFNIFFRSMLAALFYIPPQAFDNHILLPGNIKVYPAALGFFATGYFYRQVRTSGLTKKVVPLADDKNSLFLMLRLMIVMYIYLTMNLLLYYTPGNILFLKLWSMKSALSVIAGFNVAVRFIARMRELNQYRTDNLKAKNEIAEKMFEEQRLLTLAYTDPLTGLCNRAYANRHMDQLFKSDAQFSLCFADLNGLKSVNDTLGHQYGDRYLTTASNVLSSVCKRDTDLLCRYGGDEFVLLLNDCDRASAGLLMDWAGESLKSAGIFLSPFQPSFSYGIAERKEAGTMSQLLSLADQRMYEDKLEYKKNRRT